MKDLFIKYYKKYLEESEFIDLENKEKFEKTKRIKFGSFAEKFIYNDLKKRNIDIKSTRESSKYSKLTDLKYGDLYLVKSKTYLDVKLGRGISKASLDKFVGDGYILAVGVPPTGGNVSLDKFWYIDRKVLQNIYNTIEYNKEPLYHRDAKLEKKIITYAKLPSGEPGFYFNLSLIPQKQKYINWVKQFEN